MFNETFGLLGSAYDLLYQDKDYAAESDLVLELIQRWGRGRPSSILELGAGTGGHGFWLAERGIAVTGVEMSAEMLARARRREGLSLQHGDARTVRLGRTFDAVVALFHVASYQVEDVDLRRLLTTASRHLAPGGIFLFDAWYSPAVLAQGPEVRIRRIEGDGLKVLRVAEPVEDVVRSLVEVNYTFEVTRVSDGTVERATEVHRMRHVSSNEIRILAEEVGFEIVHAEGFPSGAAPSRLTWGVAFVLRRSA